MENIKAIAVKVLIDCGANSLPIDVLQLSLPNIKWTIKPFSEVAGIIKEYKELKLLEYPEKHDGFATKMNGKYYIFYNDRLGYTERNKVIAHEIGHIARGHTSSGLLFR